MAQRSAPIRDVLGRRRAILGLAALSTQGFACATRKKGLPRHYRDPTAMIQAFEDEKRDEWQLPDRVIASLPPIRKDAVVADIGAGSGYFTRRLARRVPDGRVYAVDVDGEFEDYLREHRESWGTPNIEPHLAHYDNPLLPVNSLSLVFSSNTYAYIRDRVGYFRHVRSALQPDGVLVLLDYRPDADIPPGASAPAAEHRISADRARAELETAGFIVVREETFLPFQWFLLLRSKD